MNSFNRRLFASAILMLLAVVFLVLPCFATEASRTIDQLKNAQVTPSASPSAAVSPVAAGEVKNAKDAKNIPEQARADQKEQKNQKDLNNSKEQAPASPSAGTSPASPAPAASSPGASASETPYEPLTGPLGQQSGAAWSQDPARGKPNINIALTIASLLVVCVIAYGALKIYSMYTSGDQQSPLFRKKLVNIRERHVIAPNKMLCVVELPDKTVLLGVSENDIRILTEFAPEKIAEMESQAKTEAVERPNAASYLSDILLRGWQRK